LPPEPFADSPPFPEGAWQEKMATAASGVVAESQRKERDMPLDVRPVGNSMRKSGHRKACADTKADTHLSEDGPLAGDFEYQRELVLRQDKRVPPHAAGASGLLD
jgi:hypothetical protein